MLEEYKRKRNFKLTPEPPAHNTAGAGELSFVIHKHAARRLHYDLRLEVDGVLVSWAVPKGPSLDPGHKRLAVQTEDHPFSYGQFEGVIPKGQYGAGPVIIWDQGTYTPDSGGKSSWGNRAEALERMRSGIKNGKISFYLKGNKLEGSYTLFRLANKKKDWILLKHKDSFAKPGSDITAEDRSVVSSRTINEMRDGVSAPTAPPVDWQNQQSVKSRRFPSTYKPMLASLADEPFPDQGWIFEPKLDGIRAVALIHNRKVTLLSRRGLNLTDSYPVIGRELAQHKDNLILDGEIIAIDKNGRPSFQLLQQRSGLSQAADVKAAEQANPVFFYAFDIMQIGNKNIEELPLRERKQLLKQTVVNGDHVRVIEQLGADCFTAYQACVESGLEGIMAKRPESKYEPGRRTRSWLKIKATISSEFVICGYTGGTGERQSTFGSIILGYYDRGKLVYAGGCGTGFNKDSLQQLQAKFQNSTSDQSPFSQKVLGKRIHWIKPQLVAEVKFAEWTNDGILRAPVFLRLRPDKAAIDCTRSHIIHDVQAQEPHEPMASKHKKTNLALSTMAIDENALDRLTGTVDKVTVEIEGQTLAFTNLNKVFWPQHGAQETLTKRDFAIYLLKVAPWLLPHMKDRLITLMRFPHGINGSKFYQKHWEKGLPPFVQTVDLYGEHAGADQRYLLCNNLPTLLWLAQIADLELHTWQSRINPKPDAYHLHDNFTGSVARLEQSLLNYPDYLLFDLDPYIYSGNEKSGDEPQLNHAAFRQCCQLAKWLKEIFDALSLETFIKTTGKTGLHIYVPIVRNLNFDEIRAISGAIGQTIVREHPLAVTMEWAVIRRTGKTFLDHNMNARGKTLASIFSPRVYPQASVSMPIRWQDLDNVYPSDFTMHNVPDLLRKNGDSWAQILDHKNDLRNLLNTDLINAPSKTHKRRRS